MKRLSILVLLIPFLLIACFGDDDPTDPDSGGDVSPYSGSFICSSSFMSSDCDYPAPAPPATIDISIDGDVMTIENAVGLWEENLLAGTATSNQTCVPVGPPLDCDRCFYYAFAVEYATTDSLWGTYTVTYPYSDECGTDECSTIYSIEAVRP